MIIVCYLKSYNSVQTNNYQKKKKEKKEGKHIEVTTKKCKYKCELYTIPQLLDIK